MRILDRLLIGAFAGLLVSLLACDVRVFAKEGDAVSVQIRSYDGSAVAVKSGSDLYTPLPVTLTPEGEKIYYSISIDDGKTFSDETKMEDASITLYPDDATSPTGRWRIVFSKEDEEGKKILSDTISIVFDTLQPSIEFKDPEVISSYVAEGDAVHFLLGDDNGICRALAKRGDDILAESHPEGGGTKKTMEFAVPLKCDSDSENHVDVVCYDLAGNSTVMSFTYMCDLTPPSLTLEGIENGSCSSYGRELTIKAGDNSGAAFIEYVSEREYDGKVTHVEVTGTEDGTTLSFDEDGVYTVCAEAVDAAGNRSGKESVSFTVDCTAPRIEIGGVSESVDLRSAAKLSVEVSDNMYEGGKVDISMTRTKMGMTESIPVNSYKLQADCDIRTVDIIPDGEYEITAQATDCAGNRTCSSKRFRIDKNAPDISISGVTEGSTVSDKPTLRFCAGEMFYDSTVMTTLLEKKEKGGYVPVKTGSTVMKSERDHVDVNVENEGEYRLTCNAADRSGNTSSCSLSFAVDYTPPVISGLSDVNNRFFKIFSLPKKIADLVHDSSRVSANAYLNDSAIDDDATVIEEGKYTLTIIAEDAASNVAEDSAVFVVDHTSPQIVLTGFDRNGNIQKGSLLKVNLLEDADTLQSVKFNDRNIAIKNNEAYIAVNDYGEYTLAVRAEDEAGNVTDTQVHTSCYLAGASFTGTFGTDRKVISSITKEDNSKGIAGTVIALGSVLAATGAFAVRAFRQSR